MVNVLGGMAAGTPAARVNRAVFRLWRGLIPGAWSRRASASSVSRLAGRRPGNSQEEETSSRLVPGALRLAVSAPMRASGSACAENLAHLHVLAVIEHATRRIRILGAASHPAASWVAQAARNLVMDLQDAGSRARFLIRDRDGKLADVFDDVLKDAGIEIVLSRVQMPRNDFDHGTLVS